MNLFRREIGGRDASNVVAITCVTIGKRPDPGILAALRRIFFPNKFLEALVDRDNFFVDYTDGGGTQLLLICHRNGCREFLYWLRERALFTAFRSNFLYLDSRFL